MSLTYTQILREIERNVGFDKDYIANNTQRKDDFTADINMALGDTLEAIFASDGTWQYDDSNHTDYPIITTDLVSGQQDYPFTTDGSSNLILEVYKVLAKDSQGNLQELDPFDGQQRSSNSRDLDSFISKEEGTPTKYDKFANSLFLDKIPNYDSTDGLQMYVNREGSFFTTSDTTKKPGFAGIFHEYIPLVVSYKYARNHSLANVDRLERDKLVMEEKIKDYYARRNRDVKHKLQANIENNR